MLRKMNNAELAFIALDKTIKAALEVHDARPPQPPKLVAFTPTPRTGRPGVTGPPPAPTPARPGRGLFAQGATTTTR